MQSGNSAATSSGPSGAASAVRLRKSMRGGCNMTQDELWLAKWQEAIDFLETNHRKPSKFIPEERNLRSWWKHNKKLMNAGELKPERVEMFEQLLELEEKYKHVNQYQ